MAREETGFRFEMFFDVGNRSTGRNDFGDTRGRRGNYGIDGKRRVVKFHDNDGRRTARMNSGQFKGVADWKNLDHGIEKNEQPIGNARQTCGLVSRLDLFQIDHPGVRPLKRQNISMRIRLIRPTLFGLGGGFNSGENSPLHKARPFGCSHF